MKKLAVFLLALVMLLGLLPAAAVAAEDEYVYPMSSVEKLPGTIRNSDNKYVIVNGYYGAIIDLQGLDYDTVTITRNASNNTMGYAFLRERPTSFFINQATAEEFIWWLADFLVFHIS